MDPDIRIKTTKAYDRIVVCLQEIEDLNKPLKMEVYIRMRAPSDPVNAPTGEGWMKIG